MAKVKLSLQSLTIPQKIQFIRQVVTSMTGNANFATPAPALVAITAKTESALGRAAAGKMNQPFDESQAGDAMHRDRHIF